MTKAGVTSFDITAGMFERGYTMSADICYDPMVY